MLAHKQINPIWAMVLVYKQRHYESDANNHLRHKTWGFYIYEHVLEKNLRLLLILTWYGCSNQLQLKICVASAGDSFTN